MRKPLILIDIKYAHHGFYKSATLRKSSSVKDIEIALTHAMKINSLQENLEILKCKEKKEKVVGNSYKMCYSKLLPKIS